MIPFETEYTDLITCPYCGHKDRDSWEVDWDGEVDCGSCGEVFIVTIHQHVTYSTRKPEK